jgi:hypothetical protein
MRAAARPSNLRRPTLARHARSDSMAIHALQGFKQRIAECNDAQPHLGSLTPFSIESDVVGHVKPE